MLGEPFYKKADEIIEMHAWEERSLIPIIQDIQEGYRYLPPELPTYVTKEIGIAEAKAYSVASFYENFSFEEKGKYIVKMYGGTACHVRKSISILDYLYKTLKLNAKKHTTKDALFTVETVFCLGVCGLAPAITVSEKAYPKMSPEKMKKLLEEIKRGEPDVGRG